MKIFSGLIKFIYGLVFAVVLFGSGFFLTSLSSNLPFDRDVILTRLGSIVDSSDGRMYCGIAGIVIIVMIFVYLISKARENRQESAIAFDNPNGEVSISLSAIENFVMRVGKEFSEIKSMTPKIQGRKEGVDISLKVDLWSGMNLPKVTETLQSVVKSQIQNILGIENVHSVEVMVSKIIARDKDVERSVQGDAYQEGMRTNKE